MLWSLEYLNTYVIADVVRLIFGTGFRDIVTDKILSVVLKKIKHINLDFNILAIFLGKQLPVAANQ